MFTFKKFVVRQDRTAMKVGTDGVLLGAWAPICYVSPLRILDAGTGTGLISMMLSQRFPSAVIDAIDIDPESVEQAAENVRESIFAEKIRIYQSSLQDFAPDVKYDSVVCNPPFFVRSLHCPDAQRTLARHNDSLPFSDLLSSSSRLLKDGGSLSLILPASEGEAVIKSAAEHHLYLQKAVCVHPTPASAVKRLLMHLVKDNNPPSSVPCESHLTIELSRHVYTPEYISLTQDFYLKM